MPEKWVLRGPGDPGVGNRLKKLLLQGVVILDGSGQQHLVEGADGLGVLIAGVGEGHQIIAHHGQVHDLVHQAGLSAEQRLGPVSYTHLDVYKRQAVKCFSPQAL